MNELYVVSLLDILVFIISEFQYCSRFKVTQYLLNFFEKTNQNKKAYCWCFRYYTSIQKFEIVTIFCNALKFFIFINMIQLRTTNHTTKSAVFRVIGTTIENVTLHLYIH